MRFDGATFVFERDGERLTSQYERVYAVMKDGAWHTLGELADKAQGSEAAVSARLRDMRKARFGKHTVEREYIGSGLWAYRLAR